MKFNFLLTILSLFMAFTLSAEERPLSDHITYSEDCDISNIIVSSDDFSFSVTFDPTTSFPIQGQQFRRDVKAYYSIGTSGQIFLLQDFGETNMDFTRTVTLNNSDFDALPEDQIKISFIIKYRHSQNNPYVNPLTVYDNGVYSNSKSFSNTSDAPMYVGLAAVSCFTKVECNDVSVYLYVKNGWVRSLVNPKGGNYSYTWSVTGNQEPPSGWHGYGGTAVRILPGCETYTLIVTDLDTGCEYRKSKIVCTAETPKDDDLMSGFTDESSDIDTRSSKELKETSLTLYPNPTARDLNVLVSDVKGTDVDLYIMDLQGKTLFQTKVPADQGQVKYNWTPNSTIVGGVYFVNIVDQGAVINKRFVYIK